ncbi:SprT family protein [Carnobacterium sp. TMP28]|uniref:SprT family protein n=1 Tax=Carnobacterium sp. TMP28 TaxID=3397060 RepID=UPI0039E13B6F
MNQIELQKLVEELSIDYFKRPFEHAATFNSRLRTTGGRYHLKSHNVDFNLKILETFGMLEFVKVIKHELCHYHLHLTGKGYQHKDNDFKVLLKQTGGSRFVQSVKTTSNEKKLWLYRCKNCQLIIRRQRRFDTTKFVCKKCKGKLVLQNVEEQL